MTWRRPVSTICSERSTCSALLTASRDAPVQPASSSWDSGSSISIPALARRPETLGQLDQPMRDASDDVVRCEVRLLRVGVAQPRGDHPQDHERRRAVGARGRRRRPSPGTSSASTGSSVVTVAAARLVVDRRELAQQIAGTADGDDHLAAGRAERRDLGAAGQQHDHRPGLVALMKERDAGAVGTDAGRRTADPRPRSRRARRGRRPPCSARASHAEVRNARPACGRVGAEDAHEPATDRAASRRSCSRTSRGRRTRRRGWAMTPPPRSSRVTTGSCASSSTRTAAARCAPRVTASWCCSTRRAARSRARWRSSASWRRRRTGRGCGSASNAGEVREDGGELFGAAINLAARVMDRAAGGEILVTDTVRQLAGTMPDARFRDRGRVALKGFPERQRLHQVRAADGQPAPRPQAPRRRSRRPALAAAASARRAPRPPRSCS